MIAFAWQGSDGARSLVVVNYAPQPGQCYLRLPFADLGGQQIRLQGRLGTPGYEREGNSLIAEGLYVDLPGATMFLRLATFFSVQVSALMFLIPGTYMKLHEVKSEPVE